jgi:large subunit ribosomal protein L15
MLDRLSRKHGSRPLRKRRGRGIGSGLGKTSGRGQKGAGARAGYKNRAWSEGGQMPLSRRLPKVGFRPLSRVEQRVVNVKDLARFEAGSVVDDKALAAAGLVPRKNDGVKLLAEGEIAVALTVRVAAASAAARAKVEAAGGRVEVAAREKRGAAS